MYCLIYINSKIIPSCQRDSYPQVHFFGFLKLAISIRICYSAFTNSEFAEKEYMQENMTVNQVEYKILQLLGHGKGGYNYLLSTLHSHD